MPVPYEHNSLRTLKKLRKQLSQLPVLQVKNLDSDLNLNTVWCSMELQHCGNQGRLMAQFAGLWTSPTLLWADPDEAGYGYF
jgi:hypothetical protein